MPSAVTRARTFVPMRLALIAGLLAVLVRAMIPAGFMLAAPGQGAAGPIPIILCTESGKIQALLAADGSLVEPGAASDGDVDHDDRGVDHAACVFAPTATTPAPADVAASLSVSIVVEKVAGGAITFDLVPGRGLAAPPPPSTAPPVLI